mmetsp:Transcript_49906/g.139699  ORF Transcript_49906/g.139699 Transcript_49906/m.139699 type:complete len:897 (-) Transcript_49906:180-2870(-)
MSAASAPPPADESEDTPQAGDAKTVAASRGEATVELFRAQWQSEGTTALRKTINKEQTGYESEPWIESPEAVVFFAVVIAMNAMLCGLETEVLLRYGRKSTVSRAVLLVECFFTLLFAVELGSRSSAYGLRAWLRSPINCFDAAILVVGIVSIATSDVIIGDSARASLENTGVLRYLRILRLARVVRLFGFSSELVALFNALISQVRTMRWVFIVLVVTMYFGALICTNELGRSDNPDLEAAFGSLGSSWYSHFKLMTLEAWPDLNGNAMEESSLWAAYFIGFIAITSLVLVNVVTGLIMDGVVNNDAALCWSAECQACEAQQFLDILNKFINEGSEQREFEDDGHGADMDHGLVNESAFCELTSNMAFQKLLGYFNITMRFEPSHLFRFLDADAQGELTTGELARGLLQMRGSRKSLHPVLVQMDVREKCSKSVAKVDDSSEKFVLSYCESILQLERSLEGSLRNAEGAAASTAQETELHCNRRSANNSLGHAGDDGDEVASVSSEDPLPRPTAPTLRKDGEQAESLRKHAEEQMRRERRLQRSLAHDRKDALDAQLARLLREATTQALRLDSATKVVEVELRASHAREAELRAALALETNTKDTETEAESLKQKVAALERSHHAWNSASELRPRVPRLRLERGGGDAAFQEDCPMAASVGQLRWDAATRLSDGGGCERFDRRFESPSPPRLTDRRPESLSPLHMTDHRLASPSLPYATVHQPKGFSPVSAASRRPETPVPAMATQPRTPSPSPSADRAETPSALPGADSRPRTPLLPPAEGSWPESPSSLLAGGRRPESFSPLRAAGRNAQSLALPLPVGGGEPSASLTVTRRQLAKLASCCGARAADLLETDRTSLDGPSSAARNGSGGRLKMLSQLRAKYKDSEPLREHRYG